MITMARFSPEGVRILDENGWREPEPSEWVDIGDGNSLQINAEGYWTGWWHGLAGGVLVALFTLGIVAWVVTP